MTRKSTIVQPACNTNHDKSVNETKMNARVIAVDPTKMKQSAIDKLISRRYRRAGSRFSLSSIHVMTTKYRVMHIPMAPIAPTANKRNILKAVSEKKITRIMARIVTSKSGPDCGNKFIYIIGR